MSSLNRAYIQKGVPSYKWWFQVVIHVCKIYRGRSWSPLGCRLEGLYEIMQATTTSILSLSLAFKARFKV